jgi:hypothetical protein
MSEEFISESPLRFLGSKTPTHVCGNVVIIIDISLPLTILS